MPKQLERNEKRVFSFGGGWQSSAVLALQIQGKLKIPFDYFVFANVGDDSEAPEVFDYINKWVLPACKEHDINFVEVQKTRYKTPDTIMNAIERENRNIPIPVYMASGAPGNRSCTFDFKVSVVDKWIRVNKITHAHVGIGFSADEGRRAEKKPVGWHNKQGSKKISFQKNYTFPLIELGIRRQDCPEIVKKLGWDMPVSSECWFCPFHTRNYWIELRKNNVTLFEKAIRIQDRLNEKRGYLGKERVSLHRDGLDLRDVPNQLSLWDKWSDDDESCQVGYCGL